MKETVIHLFEEQLRIWDTAAKNYAALEQVKSKKVTVQGSTFHVQFNPARIVSSAAKVDAESIRKRACFLCDENRPPVQKGISFNDKYIILINPFPIFPRHLTISSVTHMPQRIDGRLPDMLALAAGLEDYVIFYNGPRCGASAPDHLHFQAGNKGFLPFEKEWKQGSILLHESSKGALRQLNDGLRTGWVIEGSDKADVCSIFSTVYTLLPEIPAGDEPMLNLLAWYEGGKWIVVIFPRKKHRPDCYYAEGEGLLTISPASVDMGGVFITPLEKDYMKITPGAISGILREVCLDKADVEIINNRLRELL